MSTTDDREDPPLVSRRELIRRASVAGVVAAALPVGVFSQAAAPARAPLETLTEAEGGTLDAIVARLIPTDATGPGATEALAARYIDRALGGALASSRDAYRAGLSALDSYARTSKGAAFAQLSAQNQDAVLRDLESNVATGFTPDAQAFFTLVLAHTIQGTFCDPFYGGNASFVGWDLIGYPGVRLIATANEQRLDAAASPVHMSAYDYSMFSKKKPARASVDRDESHHAG